jgi:hypothetical protein
LLDIFSAARTEGSAKCCCPGRLAAKFSLPINRQLQAQGTKATLAIDNAHRVAAEDICALTTGCDQINFVLLCQPSPTVHELEALLAIQTEALRGWSTDTIAAEGHACGCCGDFATYERLRASTGGLPLYVQNALRIAANEYGGMLHGFALISRRKPTSPKLHKKSFFAAPLPNSAHLTERA